MSAIIKATDRNAAIQCVAFNFEDMTARAHQYLKQVQAQAAQIIARAQQQAALLRQKAEAEGRRAGQEAIEEIVRTQLGQQLSTLLPALRQAIQEIHNAKHAFLAQWEKQTVHLAAAIASRVIRRELAKTPEIPLALVREALELAAGSAQIRVRLHPDDHQALRPQVEAIVAELAALAPAEVLPDPQVSRGGCLVETRFGQIDQQFEAQLARIEEELT